MLSPLYDDPGGDHGLVFAIPAENPPRKRLKIMPLDLALLAKVFSQDVRHTGPDPAMSDWTTRRLTHLS